VPQPVQPLAYEVPFDPEVARLEPVDGGVVFVLPPEHTVALVSVFLASLPVLAVSLAGAGLIFAIRSGWLPPLNDSRGEPIGTFRDAVLASLVLAGGVLMTSWSAARLFARCRGVREPQRRRLSRTISASARGRSTTITVNVERVWIWPGWGLRVSGRDARGRYVWTAFIRTGGTRGPAETLAAELRRMWDLPGGEGDRECGPRGEPTRIVRRPPAGPAPR
jgi:hypothetical protein